MWFYDPENPSTLCLGYQAIGVVLGQISGLIVIDIDTIEQAEKFAAAFPDLIDTLTVRSGVRGLPHYYFQVEQTIPSTRLPGAELRSDGNYIVAPGTVIGERVWSVENNRTPRKLTESDLSRLSAFFNTTAHKKRKKRSQVPSEPAKPLSEIDSPPDVEWLIREYRKRAYLDGRNNALFYVACLARDYGLSEAQAGQLLADLHAHQPTRHEHAPQSLSARVREAVATVASAFTRSPRERITSKNNFRQLPNVLREFLLQQKLVQASRVLDALLIAGVDALTELTVASVYDHVKEFGIGRGTVIAALKTVVTFPPPPPPGTNANAARRSAEETKQCLFGRVANPTKNRGRPTQIVLMPDVQTLCERFELRNRGGDELKPEDLQTAATYRAALHTALLERSPGHYPRRWLAQRLGISKDSCRRYERAHEITVQPTYRETEITWANVDKAVPVIDITGTFLEDQNGKRYPAKTVIARMLLVRKSRVVLKTQDANLYGLPLMTVPTQPVLFPTAQDATKIAEEPPSEEMLPPRTFQTPEPENVVEQDTPEIVPDAPIFQSPGQEPEADDTPRQHDSGLDIGRCTERLYDLLRALNPARALSRKKAAALVRQHGIAAVESAMKILEKRRNIYNPAGFIHVLLRGESSKST